ncbi:MAG TPA: MerR family transcriptional regulator [Ktedonobacterales bacterium]|jgi:MerR family transcriptional regulator/heat shock protein HspR
MDQTHLTSGRRAARGAQPAPELGDDATVAPSVDLTAPHAAAAPGGSAPGGRSTHGHIIAVAARRAGVHQQTLRHYERLGLIVPARKGASPRSPRLYSDEDIARVIHIRQLMGDLGVNLAGVETILNMRDRMEALRRELEGELRRLRHEHEAETKRLLAIIEDLRG